MGSPGSRQDRQPGDTRITVIGAGVIGLACALELRRRGFSVQVLDRQAPGMGASYGNAGHMATEQVFPIADASILTQLPAMLRDPMGPLRLDWRYLPRALPWFTRLLLNLRSAPYASSVSGIRALNEASLDAWRQLLDSIDGRHLMKEDGSLLVYEQDQSKPRIDQLAAAMSAQGVALESWSGDAIRELAPSLSAKLRGGLFFPATAHVVDPAAITAALVDAARQEGVTFATAEVRTARVHGQGQGVSLQTDTGALDCERVLLACGAHSAPLAAELTGRRVPLDTERGYHLMLPAERHRLPVAVTSLERRFIMTPMSDGLRLAGTVEFAGLKRPPNMARAWQLQRLSQGLFEHDLDATDAKPWMGFRPSLPDSLPIIDSARDGRVLLAFGHHHLGLTQAAVTAKLVGRLATGKTAPAAGPLSLPPLSPYRLER
ncbi:MAG: FAD-dependent oxidoreductase, partial [Halomonas sp.]|nr:FAD-dependent oxidoreductase [Halomonas sp.]